jgi:DNA mismatch repair protein MSH4
MEVGLVDRKFFDETHGLIQLNELSDSTSIHVLVDSKYLALSSANALLYYITTTHKMAFMPRSIRVDFKTSDSTVLLDPMTIKALELLESNRIIISSNLKPTTSSLTGAAGSKFGGLTGEAPGGSQRGRGPIKCLFDVLNHTQTPQGARFLKANLLQPPSDLNTILFRQSAVSALLEDENLYFQLQSALIAFSDPNPILSMLVRSPHSTSSTSASSSASSAASSKDDMQETLSQARSRISTFLKLKRSLTGVKTLQHIVASSDHPFFKALQDVLSQPDLDLIYKLLCDSMADVSITADAAATTKAPKRISIQQRDVIFALKQGLNGLLDAARRVYSERIEDIKEAFEVYKTDFPELPMSLCHSVSRGYYLRILEQMDHTEPASQKPQGQRGIIEEIGDEDDEENEDLQTPVSRSLVHCLPDFFVLRVKRGRRIEFTTEDLVALNGRLTESMNEIVLLSAKLLLGVHIQICDKIGCLYNLSEMISLLDMVHSFATFVALSKEECVCPILNKNGQFIISQGFHPIMLSQSTDSSHPVIPNNIHSSQAGSHFQIITGKNNSGKTTLLLQVATLVVLSHIGCFVPAKFASIGLVDRIMARMARQDHEIASADPNASSSAFFNEMKEVAYILDSSTSKSLVLLDEVGKSTSSEDGVPLCMAISENLMARKVTTFFATHFLDMASKLHDMYPEIMVLKMSSEKILDKLTGENHTKARFLLVEGCEEDCGYGIELASHACWPSSAINTAHLIRLEIMNTISTKAYNSLSASRSSQIQKLKRLVVEQLEIARNASMDPITLHMFLHKISMRYRQKLDEITTQVTHE